MFNNNYWWGYFLLIVLLFKSITCQYLSITFCIQDSLNKFIPSDINEDEHSECNHQSNLYQNNLKQSIYWATRLKDASANSINGLLTGDKFHLGHYDQCISTELKDSHLKGQYCLVDLQIDIEDIYGKHLTDDLKIMNESIRDKIMVRRDILHVGICAPSGCSSKEVESSFQNLLNTNDMCRGIKINVTIPNHQCTMSNEYQWNRSKVIFCSFISILFLLVGLSTILELVFCSSKQLIGEHPYSRGGKLAQFMLPFSMINNVRSLSQEDSNNLHIISVLKFSFTMVIVFGHRYLTLIYVQHPVHNMEQMEKSYTDMDYALLHSGSIVNDLFLSMSGFVASYRLLKYCESRKSFSLMKYILRKIFRFYPAYIFTIAFTTIILSDIRDGPYWNMEIQPIVEECQQNWWTNILFLNTYINSENMCLISSWYIATNVHFMIVSSILICILWKRPIFGRCLLLISLVISIILLFCIIYFSQQPPVLPFFIRTLRNIWSSDIYRQRYIKSYARATPYIIGILFANLMFYMRKFQYKLSSIVGLIWFILFFISGAFVIRYATYTSLLQQYTPLENAIYGVIINIMFTITASGLYMSHINSVGFGVFDNVIKSKFINVLGKLTFWVYSLNINFQQILAASGRTSAVFSVSTLIWSSCGDLVILYVISLILYLNIEVPIMFFVNKILSERKQLKNKDS